MTATCVKFLVFIYLSFSMGSIMSVEKNYTKEEDALMSRSVGEVVNTLKKEMKELYGLRCTGKGVSMPYDIQEIGVDFLLHQQVTIEQARELEIRSTERFVKIINTHEAIRPYLRDYPWDHNRARIMISFEQDNGEDYPEGIRLVLQAHERIAYFGPKKSPNEVGPTQRESYAEAKKIVESSPSCLNPKPVEIQKKKWFDWF